jgi:hypothetical protein
MLRTSWFAVAIAVASSPGCASRECTGIGCSSGATMKADLPMTYDELQRSEITVCRNDECLSNPLAALVPPSAGTGVGLTLPASLATNDGAPHARVSFWAGPGDLLWLEAEWVAWAPADLRAGDRYRVTITDAAGRARLALTETAASYQESYPNGRDCDPVPCRHASFDRREARTR